MSLQIVIPLVAVALVAAFVLWGVIYTWVTGKPFIVVNSGNSAPTSEQSPYHQLLDTPADRLTDDQKRSQLSGAIAWQNEGRIFEILATDKGFLSKVAKYNSKTWIGQAVDRGCSLDVLDRLLESGCDVNEQLDSRPIEIAVNKDRIDALGWLLKNGADPNLGRPIVAAVNHNKSPELQLEMLELLLNGGANINNTFPLFGDEQNSFTVLDWAVLYGLSPQVIEYLRLRGAIHKWPPEKIASAQGDLQPRRIVE
mgnify:CR=1 FL=1